jgi:hypothetical protein
MLAFMTGTKTVPERQPGDIGSASPWARGAGSRPSALSAQQKASLAQLGDAAAGTSRLADSTSRVKHHKGIVISLMLFKRQTEGISGTLL